MDILTIKAALEEAGRQNRMTSWSPMGCDSKVHTVFSFTIGRAMNESDYEMDEHELSSFIAAGPEQADLFAKDWLDESDSMNTPPFSTERNWCAISIAASARLANRLTTLRQGNTAAS